MITTLDGIYEVHPAADEQYYCVVNSKTGLVRNEGLKYDDAVELATELNGDTDSN